MNFVRVGQHIINLDTVSRIELFETKLSLYFAYAFKDMPATLTLAEPESIILLKHLETLPGWKALE
jgi:hypothetical protein